MVVNAQARADVLRQRDPLAVADGDYDEQEEALDDDAQYQADLEADLERDRQATQQPAF